MFKFNFSSPNQETEEENTCNIVTKETILEDDDVKKEEGRIVEITSRHHEKVEQYQQDPKAIHVFRNFSLVNVLNLEETLSDFNTSHSFTNITTAIQMNSDVIKGVYEGGLKIWECTMDLLDFFDKEIISFKDMNVLDLGCGAGVLGIQAVLKEACSVHFQDYNTDVLELVTIPNLLLNMPAKDAEKKVKFFSGDWELLEDMLGLYDVVLTAETIYSPDNYMKLLTIFDKVTKPFGVIYVAAKQHYFGVGGNIRQFEKLLMDSKKWCAKSVFVTEEGVKREILELTRISQDETPL